MAGVDMRTLPRQYHTRLDTLDAVQPQARRPAGPPFQQAPRPAPRAQAPNPRPGCLLPRLQALDLALKVLLIAAERYGAHGLPGADGGQAGLPAESCSVSDIGRWPGGGWGAVW